MIGWRLVRRRRNVQQVAHAGAHQVVHLALTRQLDYTDTAKSSTHQYFATYELGPAVFAWVVAHTGTSRNAILSVVAFFIAGAFLLTFRAVGDELPVAFTSVMGRPWVGPMTFTPSRSIRWAISSA